MSDSNPNLEGPFPSGSPVVNETRLESTNSQIGNAAQIVASPGAVLNQNITQVQTSPGVKGTDLIFWAVMVLVIFLVTSRVMINIGLPPIVGQLVAGGIFAGIVWKFFERVESLLTDTTKSEIAVWLVGVKVADRIPWPSTFTRTFDRVFGESTFSLKCFWRSSIVSICLVVLISHKSFLSLLQGQKEEGDWRLVPVFLIVFCVIPDYLSLLKSRFLLSKIATTESRLKTIAILVLDTYLTLLVASFSILLGVWFIVEGDGGLLGYSKDVSLLHKVENGFGGVYDALANEFVPSDSLLFFSLKPLIDSEGTFGVTSLTDLVSYPICFTSIWLWLYAGSGFLLKAAKRFDLGFHWFNAKFDIEKKPLQAIGLVSGALVALVYWSWATFRHFFPA